MLQIKVCIGLVFLGVGWVTVALIVLELGMSVIVFHVLTIGWLVIGFYAIMEQNAFITQPYATELKTVWMKQMSQFVTGILVGVAPGNFPVPTEEGARI